MVSKRLPRLVAVLATLSLLGTLTLAAQTAQNYVIGPQDVISITCLDDPALTGKFTVQADGTFTLPYIGSVKAADLTIRQFEESLKKQLKDGRFFKNPQITVSIEQYRSQRVILMGEVARPGPYPLTGGMTLLELIAQAGTLTPMASGTILIIPAKSARAEPLINGDGQSTGNALTDPGIIRADFSQLQNGTLERPIELHDGDTIIVQQAERAYILGEVKSPGAHPVQRTTTLQQLIALAGGQTADAALNRIKIVRFENGVRIELLKAKLTEVVRPGDTVIVPTKFF